MKNIIINITAAFIIVFFFSGSINLSDGKLLLPDNQIIKSSVSLNAVAGDKKKEETACPYLRKIEKNQCPYLMNENKSDTRIKENESVCPYSEKRKSPKKIKYLELKHS